MARRDVFANITAPQDGAKERKASAGYAAKGASRSMISSLNELAEKAALAETLSGERVVELDTAELETSFVSDRMGEDDAAYAELVAAIRERGQDSPILVRPHPTAEGRYQIVFGHRRARAARELGRTVRAVIKDISDADHVIAQGQENSARQNLSFIERSMFAQRLADLGYDKPTIQAALAVDAPMLTRMFSVSSRVPEDVVQRIGPARSIGRDRWIDFAQKIEKPSVKALVLASLEADGFDGLESDARFERLVAEINKAERPQKQPRNTGEWRAGDASVRAEFKGAGKSYSIALKSDQAAKFGRFITDNLERLHQEFLSASRTEER
ncbi:chromosome partitioning protein, ParB family [Rhizobium sp. RU20A]|uniref:plasmid partitioning protein RepB n=1 Tax=Rhizobium sp. RU20A TaxID=1907412 RepID=UPI000957100B|nr:plasmid partitioning protein RepB [Rhizobium sp. RU20A]SIR37408.1 chromosome partitioning protein, ParB family [Rhizobium sp. RU20A]